MALIKSKQLKDVAATKVVETAEKRFVSDADKLAYADKYTKTETDSKDKVITDSIGALSTTLTDQMNTMQNNFTTQLTSALAGIVWKNPVPTFADIATVYPTPEEGWTVTVADTDKGYRYDKATATWIDFPVGGTGTSGYSKTILVPITANNVTAINTGIRNDGTGVYKSKYQDISLAINGFIQAPGADKDYTVAFVSGELVLTWNDRHFKLETDDEMEITYTHNDVL